VQLTKLTPSKVTVTTELERLVPILMQKQDRAQTEGTSLSKRALFDPINKYFIGCNEHFGPKDASKYRDAMKLIAISMSNAEWNRLIVIGRKSADGTSGGNDNERSCFCYKEEHNGHSEAPTDRSFGASSR